jgi:unsaturated rhamnogalacturonyl hydrolase
MKGVRLGILPEEKYFKTGRQIFEGIAAHKLKKTEQGTVLTDIVKVGGLGGEGMRDGTVSYYLSEPRVENDSKGVGPFIMAYVEYLRGCNQT